MADRKNPQDTPEKSPRELDERQLEQASGGRARPDPLDPEPPRPGKN
jgi:hypothetical protein